MMQKFENYFDVFFINQKYQFDEQPNQLNDTNAKDIIILNSNFISTLGYLNLESSTYKETISFAKGNNLENNILHHTDFIINCKLGNYGFIYNQLFVEFLLNPNQFPSVETLINFPIQLSSKIDDEIVVIRIKKIEPNNSPKFKSSKSPDFSKIDFKFQLIILETLAIKIVEIIKNKYINNSKKKMLILNLGFEEPTIIEQLKIIQNAQSIAQKQLEMYKTANNFLKEKEKFFTDLQLNLKMNYEE